MEQSTYDSEFEGYNSNDTDIGIEKMGRRSKNGNCSNVVIEKIVIMVVTEKVIVNSSNFSFSITRTY